MCTECGFLDRYFYLSLNKKSPLQLISVGFCHISTCQLQIAADHQHSPMVNFTILHHHSPVFAANDNCALSQLPWCAAQALHCKVRSIIGVLTVLCLYTAVDSLILESFSDLRVSMLSTVSTVSTPQCPLYSVQSVHHSVSAPIASGAKPPLVTHRMIMICHGHHPGDSC